MNFEKIRQLIAQSELRGSCLDMVRNYLQSGEAIEEPSIGSLSVGAAIAMYEIRAASARAAGISVSGIGEAIEAMKSLSDERSILLCHFVIQGVVCTVLIEGSEGNLIGCISVFPKASRDSADKPSVT